MKRNLLIIEDDEIKLQNIVSFLDKKYIDFNIDIAKSYISGLKKINTNDYELILLDMSMPTYDKNSTEQGGIWEKFAGKRILSEIKRKRKNVKVIVVTMYDKFGEGNSADSLENIHKELSDNFPEFYLGKVFYSAKILAWGNDLELLLNKFISDNNGQHTNN